jgi:amidohydrolase
VTLERNDDISRITAEILPDLVELRHHLHRNPELSNEEMETSALVAARLRKIGYVDIRTEVGGHGVIATLKGKRPGKTFALRGDMDALPVTEESDLPYRSCKPGVMHACGHDGHTTNLLGAAAVLFRLRDRLAGTVRFLFQPSEEIVGGAARMCAEGAMEGVDAVVALHGWPGLEIGMIGVLAGPIMASADTFDIRLAGRQAHAAMPNTAVDPIVTGAHIVTALQTIASRETSPLDSIVVTVTQFHAGTAYNIIPGAAELKGTVRTLSDAVRRTAPARMERIVAGISSACGASYEFSYRHGPPVVTNDAAIIDLIAGVTAERYGRESVMTLESPSMGAEDFSVYLQHAPGALLRIGVGAASPNLHTPTYNYPDAALPIGIEIFVRTALAFLDSEEM